MPQSEIRRHHQASRQEPTIIATHYESTVCISHQIRSAAKADLVEDATCFSLPIGGSHSCPAILPIRGSEVYSVCSWVNFTSSQTCRITADRYQRARLRPIS